ncbi:MAG: lasso peptide biosynthesis PqqD family chaperone [Bacillota bacterium]
MLNSSSIIVRTNKIITADMDGDTALMSVNNGAYYGLGKVGTAIWNELAAPLTVAALIEKLCQRFAVSATQCEQDIQPFLGDMLAEKLIELANEKSSNN